ncbi:hypothetical protein [Pantoea agglomerans]|uniref:hypothetical protein n=1 Tax=Enterobacter agglomerans TaxID=549 RepID=UPI002016FE8D|nr:hypothetical protein [Pantoea agglomerans]
MTISLDEIGKDAPSSKNTPDWTAPAGSSATPEPSTSKHPDERAQDVEDRKSNRELRDKYAGKAYKVAKYGLYWWAIVLLLSVVGKVVGVELFSDSVLIAITSASTLNLFAAFLGVIRGLFPSATKD